jgi:hypothetical protein
MSLKVTMAGWGAMANDLTGEAAPGAARTKRYLVRPSRVQAAYLSRGLNQPGGKLPLFDRRGQRYKPHTVQSCIEQGWAEPWFDNPMKPDWLICKLTEAGRDALEAEREADNGTVLVLDFARLRCSA